VIILRGTEGGDEMLILGLSEQNIKKLQEGKPMYLTRKTHGDGIPQGWRIMIFTGKDENKMTEMVKPFLGPDTEIKIDPRLG
jgi:hypothetical protein